MMFKSGVVMPTSTIGPLNLFKMMPPVNSKKSPGVPVISSYNIISGTTIDDISTVSEKMRVNTSEDRLKLKAFNTGSVVSGKTSLASSPLVGGISLM